MLDKGKYQNEPLVYVIDGDLSYLRRKLKKESSVKGRIVLCLGDNRYLLRIFGYNLVMKTRLNFERFDEVKLIVKQAEPNLILSVATGNQIMNKVHGPSPGSGELDLFI
jgi:hypothetical protein